MYILIACQFRLHLVDFADGELAGTGRRIHSCSKTEGVAVDKLIRCLLEDGDGTVSYRLLYQVSGFGLSLSLNRRVCCLIRSSLVLSVDAGSAR